MRKGKVLTWEYFEVGWKLGQPSTNLGETWTSGCGCLTVAFAPLLLRDTLGKMRQAWVALEDSLSLLKPLFTPPPHRHGRQVNLVPGSAFWLKALKERAGVQGEAQTPAARGNSCSWTHLSATNLKWKLE